uniref:Uncharacterized protein n=1 Tax=Arundo donax TaxID=35708 RepID=A0A0A9HQA5_ARUDO
MHICCFTLDFFIDLYMFWNKKKYSNYFVASKNVILFLGARYAMCFQ